LTALSVSDERGAREKRSAGVYLRPEEEIPVMRVTVHYLAQMKRAAGCSSEAVEIHEAATLQELLAVLADRHGSPLRSMLLDEKNQPLRSLLFFVGEAHADPTHRLQAENEVTILAPMAGG
jgi:molybdopterin converting factor small subunit